MTEQEQIEVWRRQFESVYEIEGCYFCEESGRYRNKDGSFEAHNMNIRYVAWIKAREYQPVIELPKDDGSISQSAYQLEVIAMLGKQGYQYKVKE